MTLSWCHSIIFFSLFLISSKKWPVPLWFRCSKMVSWTFLFPPSLNSKATIKFTPSSTTTSFMPSAITSRHRIVAPQSSSASCTGPAASSSSSSPSSSLSSIPIFPASGPSLFCKLSVHFFSIIALSSWMVQIAVSTQFLGMNFLPFSFLMRFLVWEMSFFKVGSYLISATTSSACLGSLSMRSTRWSVLSSLIVSCKSSSLSISLMNFFKLVTSSSSLSLSISSTGSPIRTSTCRGRSTAERASELMLMLSMAL
mmetsp:Transcript_9305/g.18867  ORF Transcript_9305/g.18867 Transcript_9305/m.18867 type:complete len:255 (-) Transcript_9305:5606-6370(-)